MKIKTYILSLLLLLCTCTIVHAQTTPIGLAFTTDGTGHKVLTWTAVSGDQNLNHYILRREGASYAVFGTTFTDSGLVNTTVYHYQIASSDSPSGLVSPFSTALNVTGGVETGNAVANTTTPPISTQNVLNVKSPPLGFVIAKGDGTGDDTAAIQADITYAESHGQNVYIPAGIYQISSPLVITNSGASTTYVSFQLFGDGMSPQGLSNTGGTTLKMIGASQDSLIQVRAGAVESHGQMRNCVTKDLYLKGNTSTSYGIHWFATGWSVWHCKSIQVDGLLASTGVAFKVDADLRIDPNTTVANTTSANGESLTLENCKTNYTYCFYENTAGQAYSHQIIGGSASSNVGGVFIKTGVTADQTSTGNYGLILTDFSCSFTTADPTNVFLQVGYGENVVVHRTRCEKVGSILQLGSATGSNSLQCLVAINDCSFPGFPTTGAMITRGLGQYTVEFNRCLITSATPNAWTQTFTMAAYTNDNSRYKFNNCRFGGFALAPTMGFPSPPATGNYPGFIMSDCWQDTSGTHALAQIVVP